MVRTTPPSLTSLLLANNFHLSHFDQTLESNVKVVVTLQRMVSYPPRNSTSRKTAVKKSREEMSSVDDLLPSAGTSVLIVYEWRRIGEASEGKQTAYQSLDTPMDDTASNAQRCKFTPFVFLSLEGLL